MAQTRLGEFCCENLKLPKQPYTKNDPQDCILFIWMSLMTQRLEQERRSSFKCTIVLTDPMWCELYIALTTVVDFIRTWQRRTTMKIFFLLGFLAGLAAAVPTCDQIATMRTAIGGSLKNATPAMYLRLGWYFFKDCQGWGIVLNGAFLSFPY